MLLCCYYEAIAVSWVFLSSTLLVSLGTHVLFVEWSDDQMDSQFIHRMGIMVYNCTYMYMYT